MPAIHTRKSEKEPFSLTSIEIFVVCILDKTPRGAKYMAETKTKLRASIKKTKKGIKRAKEQTVKLNQQAQHA